MHFNRAFRQAVEERILREREASLRWGVVPSTPEEKRALARKFYVEGLSVKKAAKKAGVSFSVAYRATMDVRR